MFIKIRTDSYIIFCVLLLFLLFFFWFSFGGRTLYIFVAAITLDLFSIDICEKKSTLYDRKHTRTYLQCPSFLFHSLVSMCALSRSLPLREHHFCQWLTCTPIAYWYRFILFSRQAIYIMKACVYEWTRSEHVDFFFFLFSYIFDRLWFIFQMHVCTKILIEMNIDDFI